MAKIFIIFIRKTTPDSVVFLVEIRGGDDAVTTCFFGFVECFVGKRDDLFAVGCMGCDGGVVGGDAEACCDGGGEGAETVGKVACFDGGAELFGDRMGIGGAAFGQDDAELFSSVAGGKVDASDVVVEDLADLGEQFVACEVSVGVVVSFEVVKVEHDETELTFERGRTP